MFTTTLLPSMSGIRDRQPDHPSDTADLWPDERGVKNNNGIRPDLRCVFSSRLDRHAQHDVGRHDFR